ncbi:MAG: translation initiation factor IF-6 [Candidatus Bathyarchaeia archaeon]
MGIVLLDLMGSPNVGAYILTTDSYIILPPIVPESKISRIKETLNGEVVCTNVGGFSIIGALAAANSNGVVLPHYTTDDEIKAIRSVVDINVDRIECRMTALGNLVLANDLGAIADARLLREPGVAEEVEDVLGVEVVPGEIAVLPYVGSLAVATNHGVLAHPMLKEEERERLFEVLKVPIDVGTVNQGVPFVKSGLLVNSHGAIAGSLTTGPEIFIISNLFGL